MTTPAGEFLVLWSPGRAVLTTPAGQTRQQFAMRDKLSTHAVVVDRAGKLLAHASNFAAITPDELTIFDLATGRVIRQCDPPQVELRSIAFSPDGRLLAAGGDDRTVQIWDAGSGASLKVLNGHKGHVISVAFSPDGRRILSASADGTFRQWDAAGGLAIDERYGHDGPVNTAAYALSGTWIVSGGADGTVRYWRSDGVPRSQSSRGTPAL